MAAAYISLMHMSYISLSDGKDAVRKLICSAPSQPPCVCVTGQAPYTCNLGVLSKLGRLRSLDFAVTAQLRLPLSVKLVSTLALSWPHLTVSAFLLTHLQTSTHQLEDQESPGRVCCPCCMCRIGGKPCVQLLIVSSRLFFPEASRVARSQSKPYHPV